MGLTKAQRYNRMFDRIYAEAKKLQVECLGCKKLYHYEHAKCPNCGSMDKQPWI